MENYKEITKKSYNKHAEYFSKYFKGLVDVPGRPVFHRFVELLSGKGKILDLGCGGGDHSVWFKNKGFDVHAIDLSEEMVRLAKGKDIDAQVMDIENLEFRDNFFDGIWAVTSLLHVPKEKLPKVVSKLSNILKADGILFVVLKEGEEENFIEDKHDDSTKRFFVLWKKDELLEVFKNNFELVRFWENKPRGTNYLHFFFRNKKSS